jgi:methyltransferase
MIFIFFISFLILLRTGELLISKRNEKWLLQHNAVEFGKKHYRFIVALHVFFIISLIIEYFNESKNSLSLFFFTFYFFLLAGKTWIISTLGKFWNTKIYRVPSIPLIKKGPYKYCKHPNYLIVIAEIAVIPLIFQLYYTANVFTILNAIILWVRIKQENKALATGAYCDVFDQIPNGTVV